MVVQCFVVLCFGGLDIFSRLFNNPCYSPNMNVICRSKVNNIVKPLNNEKEKPLSDELCKQYIKDLKAMFGRISHYLMNIHIISFCFEVIFIRQNRSVLSKILSIPHWKVLKTNYHQSTSRSFKSFVSIQIRLSQTTNDKTFWKKKDQIWITLE